MKDCVVSAAAVLDGRNYTIRHVIARERLALPAHTHERAQVVIVLSGEWRDASEAERVLRAGEMLVHPPHTVHSAEVSAGAELLHVELSEEFVEVFCPLYGGFPRSLTFRVESFDGGVEQLWQEVRHGSAASPLVLESLLFQIAAIGARSLADTAPRAPEWLTRVRAYIHLHAREQLTSARLATIACMSPSALSHAFRDRMGVTVGQYIRDYRVRLAARALRQTTYPIKQIAAATGFYDQAHLCRVFKAARNLTPAEYRRMRVSEPAGIEKSS